MAIQCTRCGSQKVVPQAPLWIPRDMLSETLRAYVNTRPNAALFTGTVYASLYARVCGECGYTELFAADPEKFYEAHLRSLE